MNEFKLTRRQYRHLEKLPEERRQLTIKGWEGSKASAIRSACYECSGNSTHEARRCTAEACSLYGVNPYRRGLDTDTEEPENQG